MTEVPVNAQSWIVSGAGVAVVLYIVAQGVYGLRAFNKVASGLNLIEQAFRSFELAVKDDFIAIKGDIKSEQDRRHLQFETLDPKVNYLQQELGKCQGRLDTMEKVVFTTKKD